MCTYCGAKCDECSFKANCKGCIETCGKPFGGTCIAAEYIKFGGMDSYLEAKKLLLSEVNDLLKANGLPSADALYELSGEFVNLPYTLPSGKAVKFLDDTKIYLGTQIEYGNLGICYGVVCDTSFIMVSSYSVNGSEPELLIFKKR